MATQNARTQSPPKYITNKEIGKIIQRFRARLRQSGLRSRGVQQVLLTPGNKVMDDMLDVLRQHVAVAELIVLPIPDTGIRITGARTALMFTGCQIDADEHELDSLLESAPRNEQVGEASFFELDHPADDDDLETQLAYRGLEAIDLYSLAELNSANRNLLVEKPHLTHWKDGEEWCTARFYPESDKRIVSVHRGLYNKYGPWWYVGRRKQA